MSQKINLTSRVLCLVLILLTIFTLSVVKAESKEIHNQVIVLYDSPEHDFDELGVDPNKIFAVENVSDTIDLVYLSNEYVAEDVITTIKQNECVKAVDYNATVEVEDVNDAYYQEYQQQYLNQIGFSYDLSVGTKPIKVAVVDTGVDATHQDLSGRVDTDSGYNFIDNNNDTSDKQHHGTFVAGVIAANSNNGVGITGATGSASVTIVPYVVMGSDGTGSLENLTAALVKIKDEQDIKVVNLSLGSEHNDVLRTLCNELKTQGKIVVCASGNENQPTLSFPARYDSTISVGAVNINNQRCSPVDWGKDSKTLKDQGSNYGLELDLVAPGNNIYSTYPKNNYQGGSGTSYAAPFVSAACALALTNQTDQNTINFETIKSALHNTSKDLNLIGRDDETGYGLLQLNYFTQFFSHLNEVVDSNISGITIDGERTLNLMIGDQKQLSTKHQSDISIGTINWMSNNPEVVEVGSQGNITAKQIGQAKVIAQYGRYTDFITVTVGKRATAVKINSNRKIELTVGNSQTLSASLTPSDATETIKWISSDPNTVSINENTGYISALKVGSNIRITAQCKNCSDNIEVTVNPIQEKPSGGQTGGTIIPPSSGAAPSAGPMTPITPPQSGTGNNTIAVKNVSVSPTTGSVEVGDSLQLKATLTPENATDKTVTWKSADSSIATVNQSGLVTAKSVGTVKITVTTKDGNHTATCTITVKKKQETVTPPSKPNTPSKPEQPSQPTQPNQPTQPSQPVQSTMPIYRLYNEANNEHLYTSDANEVRVLAANGWKEEGIGWNAPTSGEGVYGLYSPVTNEHHYTKDTNEVSVLKNSGWSVDNGEKPLFYSGGPKSVYRLYHEGTRRHHLTTDENEYNVLGSNSWNREGIALYSLS